MGDPPHAGRRRAVPRVHGLRVGRSVASEDRVIDLRLPPDSAVIREESRPEVYVVFGRAPPYHARPFLLASPTRWCQQSPRLFAYLCATD